jgi:hypothetical protein
MLPKQQVNQIKDYFRKQQSTELLPLQVDGMSFLQQMVFQQQGHLVVQQVLQQL